PRPLTTLGRAAARLPLDLTGQARLDKIGGRHADATTCFLKWNMRRLESNRNRAEETVGNWPRQSPRTAGAFSSRRTETGFSGNQLRRGVLTVRNSPFC